MKLYGMSCKVSELLETWEVAAAPAPPPLSLKLQMEGVDSLNVSLNNQQP